MLRICKAHTFPRMTGAPRSRPRSGGHFSCRYVLLTPLVTLLAWAFLAFVKMATARVSGDSSTPIADGHLSALDSSHYMEPICWETQGPHERDCVHAEPLTAKTYPLTVEMLERASSRYTTTDLSVHRAFQLARRRGVLKVVVVGGSVTYGHGCVSPAGLTARKCAWPNRLQQWFDERIEDFTVEVINAAMPKYDILDLLHNDLHDALPVELEVDLIIVDYGVNDGVIEAFDLDTNNVKLAHEVFISHVRNDMTHMPALLYAENFIAPARVRSAPQQAGNMAEIHAAVTRKYDIPMVSFRDAVWPNLEDSALAHRVWGSRVHPSWQVQQLLADVLVFFFQKSYARFVEEHGVLSHPSPQETEMSSFASKMGCMADARSFTLDASAFVGLPPPEEQVESVGWSFSKDTRGEYGLIGFGNSSRKAIASFELPCAGERRVLDIGYLKSYSGMGAVRVGVRGSDTYPDDESAKDSNETVAVFDGLWETRASVLAYAVIPTPSDVDTIRVTFEVLSADTEATYSSFLSDVVASKSESARADRKFKIVRMQCC